MGPGSPRVKQVNEAEGCRLAEPPAFCIEDFCNFCMKTIKFSLNFFLCRLLSNLSTTLVILA